VNRIEKAKPCHTKKKKNPVFPSYFSSRKIIQHFSIYVCVVIVSIFQYEIRGIFTNCLSFQFISIILLSR